jgi:hypothetical protein
MRKLVFVLVAIFVSPSAFPADLQLRLSNSSRLEVVGSFTSRELWNVTAPSSVTNGNAIVDSRVFDAEARPSDGKWRGCAIVMVGTGDLGVRPVAFRVWTRDRCDLSVTSVKTSPRTGSEFRMKLNERETADIFVNASLDVSVNGKVIGRISE